MDVRWDLEYSDDEEYFNSESLPGWNRKKGTHKIAAD